MMTSRPFIRDNLDKVEVDLTYRILGHNELEITEYTAWLWSDRNDVDAPEFQLNDNEVERLHEELHQDASTWEYSDYE